MPVDMRRVEHTAMGKRGSAFRFGLTLALILPLCGTALGQALPDPIGERLGQVPQHGSLSLLPWEDIDTYTGNAVLSFTDLVLPGNGGFDLAVVRTYNTLSFQWSWTVGPRLVIPDSPNAFPLLVHTDGRTEHLLRTNESGVYVTTAFWRVTVTEAERKIQLPNGLVWYVDASGRAERRVDPFGNQVTLHYQSDVVDYMVQQVRDKHRTLVTFDNEFDNPLYVSKIYVVADGHTSREWNYFWGDIVIQGTPHRVLSTVRPPEGGDWTFTSARSANAQGEWTHSIQIDCPTGAWVKYTTAVGPGWHPDNVTYENDLHLRSREVGGAHVPAATWQFTYSTDLQGADPGFWRYFTTIDGPSGYVARFTHGHQYPGNDFTLRESQIGTNAETTSVEWQNGSVLGDPDPEAWNNTQRAMPALVTTLRNGRTYTRRFFYADDCWNHFGQPTKVIETGDFSRRIDYQYQSFEGAVYLADRVNDVRISYAVGDETIPECGPSVYCTTTTYDSRGFMTGRSVYGVATSFTPDAQGNVETRTEWLTIDDLYTVGTRTIGASSRQQRHRNMSRRA